MSVVEYSASECSESTTDVGTSDIFDLISECGECKLESMNLVQLAHLHAGLTTNLSLVEKYSTERERQEATERSQQNQEICTSCKLIQDPRQRKVAEIRQLHLQVLTNKPADLLCTPGMFSRLEEMACKGLLDSVVAGGTRCPKCRQVTDGASIKALLTAEIVDILKYEMAQHEEISKCSLENACPRCLKFVVTLIGEESDTDTAQPVSNNHENESLKSEIEKNKEEITRLTALVETKATEIQNQTLTSMNQLSEKFEILSSQLKKGNEVVENIKIPRKLSNFNGNVWESPRLAIKMWELNLKNSETPEKEWCGLVCQVLTGRAKTWSKQQKIWEKTWKQFTENFVQHFDKDMKTDVCTFMKLYHDLECAEDMNNDRLERFILACLRAVDDNIQTLTSLFNIFLAKNPYVCSETDKTLTFTANSLVDLFWILNYGLTSGEGYHDGAIELTSTFISFMGRIIKSSYLFNDLNKIL